MTIFASQPPPLCAAALRETLLATVDLLKRRRAGEIPEHYIEAYVALHWMEWHGGNLQLTITGDNVCKQLTANLC